jgi:hypothetical protein
MAFWRNYKQDERAKLLNKNYWDSTLDEKKAAVAYKKELQAASAAVSYAIKKGKLKKAHDCKCVECGNMANQYHHYNGYGKSARLDVVPVCHGCHNMLHKMARERRK